MTRRRFTFWLGFGLFTLAERTGARALDALAAAAMKSVPAGPPTPAPLPPEAPMPQVAVEHWRSAANGTWRWFERESLVGGEWVVTGITQPVSKLTDERADASLPAASGRPAYLSDDLVPPNLRLGLKPGDPQVTAEQLAEFAEHTATETRRNRHGRPPSKWLRSLEADELKIWLRTIEVPEADVSGMTFLEHLTRDHSFDGEKVKPLDEEDQAKLHAAAHYGY